MSRRRKVGWGLSGLLVAVVVIVASAGSSGPQTERGPAGRLSVALSAPARGAGTDAGGARFGFSAHFDAQRDLGRYAALMREAGARTVRDEVDWASVELLRGRYDWASSDKWVAVAARHGLRPLLLVGTSPWWAAVAGARGRWSPPRDVRAFGAFAGRVAARYGPRGKFWRAHPSLARTLPVGMEIWNEENISAFWGGLRPDPARYARLLRSAYAAIKRVDRGMTVVAGGLAPAGGYNDVECDGSHSSPADGTAVNPINFLGDLYADGAGRSFDAVGWHPYTYSDGATATALMRPTVCSAWSQMTGTTPSARSTMVDHADADKKIWITETGAPTCVRSAPYHCLSEQQQALLATKQVDLWKSWTWAGNFYWYDIRDDGSSNNLTSDQSHFGAVLSDGSRKPVYSSLKAAWS